MRVVDTGIATSIGSRNTQQDAFVCEWLSGSTLLAAVSDGHGGAHAATYAMQQLPQGVRQELQKQAG